MELVNIITKTNSANRKKEAATLVKMTKFLRSCGAILAAHQYCGPRRALLAFPKAFLSPRALSVCNFASETSYGRLGQASNHSSSLNKVMSKSSPWVQRSRSQGGLPPPTPPSPQSGNHETPHWRQNTTTSRQAQSARVAFLYGAAILLGITEPVTGEMLRRHVSTRNQRSEASSYFVTSGAVVVFGLIWKGQTSAEDRKQRAFPKGPGFGSSLAAIQSVQGEEGICILPVYLWAIPMGTKHLVT